MIFLWNAERVVREIFELARLKLAQRLEIPWEAISIKVGLEEGRIKPELTVEEIFARRIGKDEVDQQFRELWVGLKEELQVRLKGIDERRYDNQEEKEAAPA